MKDTYHVDMRYTAHDYENKKRRDRVTIFSIAIYVALHSAVVKNHSEGRKKFKIYPYCLKIALIGSIIS